MVLQAWLKKKGLASAGKKAGRIAAEGAVQAYVHQGDKIGVLIEVNSESDFVAKNEAFMELAEDMAMQARPWCLWCSSHLFQSFRVALALNSACVLLQ